MSGVPEFPTGAVPRRLSLDDAYDTPSKPRPAPAPTEKALGVQVGGDHYKRLAIQPIEFIFANSIPFAEGSVIKYVSRWRQKGGVADLKKARHFLDLLIENESKKESQ